MSVLHGCVELIFGEPPAGTDVLWRATFQRYSYCVDPDREEYAVTAPYLRLTWYKVDRRTPKGAYLKPEFCPEDGRGLILLSSKRRFASNTKEEAIEHLRQKRIRQIKILTGQLQRAEQELRLAEYVQKAGADHGVL